MHSRDEHTCLEQLLASRDLTDPAHGRDALQDVVTGIHEDVAESLECGRQLLRLPSWENGGFGEWQRPRVRRSLVSGVVDILRSQALEPPTDRLLISPGRVYREAQSCLGHDLLIVRITRGHSGGIQLAQLVRAAMRAAGVAKDYRLLPRPGDLTQSLSVEISGSGGWQTIGQCGVVGEAHLQYAGLEPATHGAVVVCLSLEPLVAVQAGRVGTLDAHCPTAVAHSAWVDCEPPVIVSQL